MLTKTKIQVEKFNFVIFSFLTIFLIALSVFVRTPLEVVQLVLFILWYLSGRKIDSEGKALIVFGVIFVLFMPFFLMIGRDFASANFSVIVFYFLIFLVIERTRELIFDKPESENANKDK
ncbi:hypothetical protein A2619_04785 [candidate division WWE3 bacterium RIFOXYD1_FULL_39_9]|uniref:Uncharacterized protein n=1 Tax=candidate division WWE3 bacterium RIFOXYD1_FULL_39_9 TaxID=1802649 RepID=A0A1F4X6L6_UNCKA|nr:MAG: hypothetical protein A2619_04785 [candidate division WWE3 bacterium RIFOXYD1_FULL_39_9]